MVDEELTPAAGTEENPTPPAEGEVVTEPLTTDDGSDPIAALASEMGWVPKDQFRGDESEWKPAADFIKAGRDISRSMSKELRSLRDEVSRVTRTSASLAETIAAEKVAERDDYWRRVQQAAVEKGDQDTVEKAVAERAKLKVEASAPTDQAIPPETRDFVDRNKTWFHVDHLATMRAQEICDRLAKQGVSIPEQLAQAERAIRKEFPEHFPPPAKQPASVATATSRHANPSRKEKGYADMPAESQAMARDYLKRHGIPIETFAKSYWGDPANQERKVG